MTQGHSSQHYSTDFVELEDQFIMKLPEPPASLLREALDSGIANLKDRLRLKLDPEARKGTLYFDHYVLPSKLVDLPCILESHKTVDRKKVYKTADISQMLICMEDEEVEEEPAQKPVKKKETFKVDKKFLFPHGITPPLKNVRKRRFRRTLKKKVQQYSDQSEIEKEVRRLLRMDYEAHHVSWEVIDEEEEKKGEGKDVLMQGSKTNEEPSGESARRLAAEHIFGEALSDSEAEEEQEELDDESRLSEENSVSHLSDSTGFSDGGRKMYVTSFSQEMFAPPETSVVTTPASKKSPDKSPRGRQSTVGFSSLSKNELDNQLDRLKQELTEISVRRQIHEAEMASIDNMALRKRLEVGLNKMITDQTAKEQEIREVENLLSQF